MKQFATPSSQPCLPLVAKYVQPYPSGIQSQPFSRYVIGYIVRGRKRIYIGDMYREAKVGDIFFLNIGNHYIENIPDEDNSFEQITCFYSPAQLNSIIASLNTGMDMTVDTTHKCECCSEEEYVILPAWNTVKGFFMGVSQYIRYNQFTLDNVAEQIKATELIYLIMSNSDCCLKKRLLGGIDLNAQSFEQDIRNHIFDNMSIEEMAKSVNKSMTSFKKEFRNVFGQPPHRWLISQRLSRAKLLLISTSKSVSEIGNECSFPNTSHFIKLFKKEYDITPALYRSQGGHIERSLNEAPERAETSETVAINNGMTPPRAAVSESKPLR